MADLGDREEPFVGLATQTLRPPTSGRSGPLGREGSDTFQRTQNEAHGKAEEGPFQISGVHHAKAHHRHMLI